LDELYPERMRMTRPGSTMLEGIRRLRFRSGVG
jgi:hypothetical protein